MSWSVAAIGKAGAVRTKVAQQFATGMSKCIEPEESVRNAAAVMIDAALAAQDPSRAVKVAANGSQGYENWNDKTGVNNQLVITIEPLFGFVE